MKNKKLVKLIKVGVLASMAFILMFFELPLPIFPSFLKLDVSDVPALLGAFAMGPLAGVLIELIKNVLHFTVKPGMLGIGELANFIVGSAMVVTAGSLYRHQKSKKNALISLLAGVLVMALVASVGNYYLFLPLYEKFLGFPISAVVQMTAKVNSAVKDPYTLIAYSIMPFNLLKGTVISLIVFLMYKKVSPILHK
ncbi:membrane protein [Fervidicella metallireducens AeB]|uniref:Riboflavin transporter n=1 Tax=Fervidicella metallireducens AeB TaxID=1403537 RepID=A0A017RY58_9CLOT|nr:ECF transporter S component [Fervidicella metallireducens]EYE89577.1 membrane protein [Fervidicella metallireducens AeB]